MGEQKRIFISACEPSGDIHGSDLAGQLRREFPDALLDGIGGPRMRDVMRPSFAMEDLAVMGFGDVARALPRLARAFLRIRRHLFHSPPALIVTIDYSAGHLRAMRHLKKRGLTSKWLHYIAPGTWLKSSERQRILETYADYLALIYPHEVRKWQRSPLPNGFVGNPVQRAIRTFVDSSPPPAKSAHPLIGLFPGSRSAEIERNLPLLLRVGEQLAAQLGGQLRISSCQRPGTGARIAHRIAEIAGDAASIAPPRETHQLMRECHAALAVSGTVCLELALLQIPFVAIYSLSLLDQLIARYCLNLPRRLKFYSLPNLLLDRGVYPEHFGHRLDEGALLQSAVAICRDETARARCRAAGAELDELLQSRASAGDLVRAIGDLLRC